MLLWHCGLWHSSGVFSSAHCVLYLPLGSSSLRKRKYSCSVRSWEAWKNAKCKERITLLPFLNIHIITVKPNQKASGLEITEVLHFIGQKLKSVLKKKIGDQLCVTDCKTRHDILLGKSRSIQVCYRMEYKISFIYIYFFSPALRRANWAIKTRDMFVFSKRINSVHKESVRGECTVMMLPFFF